MEANASDMSCSPNTSLDTSLDKEVYPQDYVSELFNKIDWSSRVKHPRSEDRWIESGTWNKHSYTMRYLEYKVEPDQVDLKNPFHIEEGNLVRSRLVKKQKKEKKTEIELNQETEGVKGVGEEKKQEVDEEDGDYLDEYGNIKEDASSDGENTLSGIVSSSSAIKMRESNEEKIKRGKGVERGTERGNRGRGGKGRGGWKDFDDVDRKPSPDFVKSAPKLPAALQKLVFPRPSSLSWGEQETFLFKQRMEREGKLDTEGDKWIVFNNFKGLVAEEQEEFHEFTKENFNPSPSPLSSDYKRYVTEHRTARISRALSLPRWWNKVKEIRLASMDQDQSCSMLLESTLLELGNRSKAILPTLLRHKNGSKHVNLKPLPSHYTRLVHSIPPDPAIQPGTSGLSRGEARMARFGNVEQKEVKDMTKIDTEKYLHNEPCTNDPNCTMLAQLLVPDIIISASALKCIMDNHRPGFGKTWEIPFVVRTFVSERDQRTVVLFGKPLLPREVTDEDMSVLAHKVAVQVGLFLSNWDTKMDMKSDSLGTQEKARSSPEDLFGDVDINIDDLEVFGADVKASSLRQKYEKSLKAVTVSSGEGTCNEVQEKTKDLDNSPIGQVDGANDSDSDEDALVINISQDNDNLTGEKDTRKKRLIRTRNSGKQQESATEEIPETFEEKIKKTATRGKGRGRGKGSRGRESSRGASSDLSLTLSPPKSEPPTRRGRSAKHNVATNDKRMTRARTVSEASDMSTSSSSSARIKTDIKDQLPGIDSKPKDSLKKSLSDDVLDHVDEFLDNDMDVDEDKSVNDLQGMKVKERLTEIQSSDSDSDDDDEAAKLLYIKKMQLQVQQVTEVPTVNEDIEENNSVQDSDKESANVILQKKFEVSTKVVNEVSSSVSVNAKNEVADSDSDSEEDISGQDLLLRKMKMSDKGNTTGAVVKKSTTPEDLQSININSDTDSSSEDDSGGISQELLQKKLNILKQENPTQSVFPNSNTIEHRAEDTVEESDQLSQTELFGSDSESASDESGEDISPKKKLRKLSSSEDEDAEETKKALAKVGRENADSKKLKKKINVEKRLSLLAKMKQDKITIQSSDRNKRAKERDKGEMEKMDGKVGPVKKGSSKSKSPKQSSEGKNPENKDPLKPKHVASKVAKSIESKVKEEARKGLSSDSEEEKGRFDKFSSSRSNTMVGTNLLDSLLSGQGKMFSRAPVETSSSKQTVTHPDIPRYSGESISQVAPGLDLNQFKHPPPGRNISYRMWHLGDKAKPDRKLRVIVRSKVAGVTKDGVLVSPSVKLEHQSQFGAEQVSASQCCKEWISALIRPGSVPTRVRVTPDSQVCMVEQKTLQQLTQESRRVGSDPSRQLVNLHNIFSEVVRMKPGQYLLQHTPKTGAFCNVLEASHTKSGSSTMDLHTMYTTLTASNTVPGKVQYQPIDMNILTPWHIANNRVPGTFEPAGRQVTGGRGRSRGRGRGRGRARGRGRGRERSGFEEGSLPVETSEN